MTTGGRTPRIVGANAAARDAGVHPGQLVSASLAFSPDLVLRERDPEAESAALEAVASWATQFTPAVALAPPDAVLAEIGGSLRLFGGLSTLTARLSHGAHDLGYAARLALAPTSAAALLFARAETEPRVSHRDFPQAWLDTLGLAAALPRRGRSCRRRHARSRRHRDLRPGLRVAARRAGAARGRGFRRPPRSRARSRSRTAAAVRAAAALHGKARPAGAGGQRRCARVRGEPARLRAGGMAHGPRTRRRRDVARPRARALRRHRDRRVRHHRQLRARGAGARARASHRRCCASGWRASRCPRRSRRSRSRPWRPPLSPAATSDCSPATTPPRPCRCSIACARGWARPR